MPAIQLARLKQQAVLISGSFDRPEAFVSGFLAVLNFYADRTFRPGQTGAPSTLLPAYNVPKPVLRQVQGELAPLVNANPDRALELADLLWTKEVLECKLLAAALLNDLPLERAEDVIARAQKWLPDQVEPRLVEAFFEQSLIRICNKLPELFMEMTEKWMSSLRLEDKKLALRALRALVDDETFINLPYVFRQITPLVREVPSRLRSALLEVVEACARRSAGEAAYFLRQTLTMEDNPSAAWVTRQCLHVFPEENRESLRAALRS